jgi:hypothetical protein
MGAAEPPKGRKRGIVAVGVIAAIAVVGGAAVVGSQLLGDDDASPTVLVIEDPSDDGGGDLSLVELGSDPKDAAVFAKDASVVPIRRASDDPLAPPTSGPDVLPFDGGYLVAWEVYDEEDEGTSTIAVIEPGASEPTRVLLEEEGGISVVVDPTGQRLVVSAWEAGCFVGTVGEELERISRATSCDLTPSGTILAYELEYDEETSESLPSEISVFDLEGDELATFEATTANWTADGSHAISATDDEVSLIEARTGEEVATADGEALQVLSTVGADGRILIGTRSDDEATLSTLAVDGERTDLVTAPGVTGQQVLGTDTVIGATEDGDGTISLARYDADGDEEPLIDDEDGLGFAVIDQADPALLAWNADGDLWGGSATSGDLVELGSLDDGVGPTSALYDPSSATGYLFAYDDERSKASVLRIADGELETVLDGWASMWAVTGDASAVVVNAYDEDYDTLVAIDGTETNELDGADGIGQISERGAALVYTVFDGDDEDQEPTVRTVSTDASTDPEDLFAGFSLSATSWVEPGLPDAYLGNEAEDGSIWVRGGGSCGSQAAWTDDEAGSIDSSGVTGCLEVPAGGATVIIDIDADIDTVLELYDEFGDEVASSDDVDDFDPYLDVYLDEGEYQVSLYPYDDETGSFEASITIDG